MKYCSHCGTQLEDSAMFCHRCGCACENYYNPSQTYSQNHMQSTPNNNISALAIVGFVFAFLNALVGLICSIVAYKSAVTDGNLKSKNFAKTGIILSAVFLALQIILIIVFVVLIILTDTSYPPYDDWYDYMSCMVNCL